jgi:hypothetical protein
MSEQNTILIDEVGKLLGDSIGGKLAKSIADLLRLERKNAEQAERERIIRVLTEYPDDMTMDIAIALIKGETE